MFVFLEWWMSESVTNIMTYGPSLTIWHIVFYNYTWWWYFWKDTPFMVINLRKLKIFSYPPRSYCHHISMFIIVNDFHYFSCWDIKICFMLITLFNLFSHQTKTHKTNIWTKIFEHMNFPSRYWYFRIGYDRFTHY